MEKEDARPGLVAYEEYPGVLNEPSQGCLLRLRGTQGRGTAMTYAHSSSKINESYFYTVPGCPYCMPIEMRKEAYKDDATD